MQPIKFDASYDLDEFLSFAKDLKLSRKNRKMRKKRPDAQPVTKLGWYDNIMDSMIGRIVFRRKQARGGPYSFEIDSHRIKRTSVTGVVVRLRWQDAVAIHRLSRAYLIEQRQGAIALPYRCLSGEQAVNLDTLIRRQEDLLSQKKRDKAKADDTAKP